MARRLSSTAALLLLVLSLAAFAHCRSFEPEADPKSTAVVEAGDDRDENGPPNPTIPAEAVLPAEQQQQQHAGFLRLPSHGLHRHHRHGLFHRHLWWARHHGAVGEDAPRRFHRHGEALRSDLTVSPAGETREVKAVAEPDPDRSPAGEMREVEAVSEPDPDRSLPDGDGEAEVAAGTEPSFGGAHEEAAHEDKGAAVRAWRKEMQRRWWLHHHGMRIHRHHHDEEEEAAEGSKRFHHHHHDHDEEEEEEHAMGKRFRRADEYEHDESDSEDEDEEVEELVRRFRKAIMRRRSGSGHGRRFHHHHYGHHRHAEEAEKADAREEEGGVVSWIKGLVNQF